MPIQERTVPYKTWIKQSVVEALRRVFNNHADPILRETNVTVDYPNEEAKYPAIVVRFFERDIHNAGLAHFEVLDVSGSLYKFKHYFYSGDLEFAIHALTNLDRDLIADSLVQTLGMGDLNDWTQEFFDRIYTNEFDALPKGRYNHIDLNVDQLQGFGETQNAAPWMAEDALIFQASYRVGISGGFYSLPPDINKTAGFIEEVDQYPYETDQEPIPEGKPGDPAIWSPPTEEELFTDDSEM